MEKNSQPQSTDVQIVLLGKTGAGKSASGNTIIGGNRDPFKEDFSPVSVTRNCMSANTNVNGQKITVIDTVGLSETTMLYTEIDQIFKCTPDGVDVFLLVIKLGQRCTVEEQNAVKWIQENFGAKVSVHTIVLFTHGDLLPISGGEEYINKCEFLKSLVHQCSDIHHIFNNKDKDQFQVTELLRKIEDLRKKNKYRRYTELDYKTQKILAAVKAVLSPVGLIIVGALMVRLVYFLNKK